MSRFIQSKGKIYGVYRTDKHECLPVTDDASLTWHPFELELFQNWRQEERVDAQEPLEIKSVKTNSRLLLNLKRSEPRSIWLPSVKGKWKKDALTGVRRHKLEDITDLSIPSKYVCFLPEFLFTDAHPLAHFHSNFHTLPIFNSAPAITIFELLPHKSFQIKHRHNVHRRESLHVLEKNFHGLYRIASNPRIIYLTIT